MYLRFLLGAVALLLAVQASRAGEFAIPVRQALEQGQLPQSEREFARGLDAAPHDNEVRFGLGLIRFALAIERFGQRQYRFGAHLPPHASAPFFRLPVPGNPAPEAITYEKQRETWQGLLDDLAKVEATLAPMTADPTAIVVDLSAVRLNFGDADKAITLGAIVAALQHPLEPQASEPEPFEVKFDYADALWLRGYCRLLSASLEFVLAYDWRETFNRTGHLFYSRVVPPAFAPDAESPTQPEFPLGDSGEFADFVVLLHEVRWPLLDFKRLARGHAHLKQTVALSRASWTAILAETGDDREWIPGPGQTHAAVPGMAVTRAQVDTWFGFLDDVDAVLDGKKLLPHWRFAQGFNLKRALLEPREFDLVLWVAGYGAAPYLERGPILSWEEWRRWNAAFHDNFLAYAFYFN